MPSIAITPGEPAGIGPDILIQVAQKPWDATLVAIADPDMLMARAKLLQLPLTMTEITDFSELGPIVQSPGHLFVYPINIETPVTPGVLCTDNARYVLNCLDAAINACTAHPFDAMVTGPIHKGIINQAGIPFTGHTEYLANATQTEYVVMMLESQQLRVALATTHIPLSQVSEHITPTLLFGTLATLNSTLQRFFDCQHPHITVCGLNPHAGEQGYIGYEDDDIIAPVIQTLQKQGVNVTGPVSADTAFTKATCERSDVILAMYHDQGLPVLKYASFGESANITCGLPFIRTSVDHGTALPLAGTGKAKPNSLHYAMTRAITMAHTHDRL